MKVCQASKSKVPSTKNPNIPNLESKSEFPDLKLSKYKLRSGQAHLTSSQQKQEVITKKNNVYCPVRASQSEERLNSSKIPKQEYNSKLSTPLDDFQQNPKDKRNGISSEKKGEQHFEFELDGNVLTFQFVSDKRVSCPRCGDNYKNILNHLQKSKCKVSQIEDLSDKFKQFIKNNMAEEIKNQQRKWKTKSRAK